MPGQAMAHPELQPRPGPGYQYKTDRRALRRQQSGADLSSYYSVEDLRGKLRRRDGFGAKPRRPSSAKAIGVEHSDEFVAMKSAKSLSRPGSAAPGAQRRSTLKTTPSKAQPRDAMDSAARGQAPKKVVGLVRHDREFAWVLGRRTRPGSAIREAMDAAKKPEVVETEKKVERVLERVKEEYFPISRLWYLRNHAADSTRSQPVGAQVRRVASGSCLITAGQHAKYRERTTTLLNQVTQLNRQVDLKSAQLERIERQFVALSTGTKGNSSNPVISFSRFVQVMKAVGCGDKAGEADFLKRFYKIMDRDGDKTLDFGELLDGLAILLEGTPRQKLQLFYVMYAYHDPNQVGKHYHDDAERTELEQGLSMFNIYRVLMAVLQHYCGVDESDGSQMVEAVDNAMADGDPGTSSSSGSGGTRSFEQKQADFNQFHNSLDKDGDGRVTFEELWFKFSMTPTVLSCIEGQTLSLVQEGDTAQASAPSSPRSPTRKSLSGSSGGGARASGRAGRSGGRARGGRGSSGRNSRRKQKQPQPRKMMRFNREGLDVMSRSRDAPAAGAAENDTSTPKTAAARRAAEAAEALLREKVGVISDAEQAAFRAQPSPSGSAVEQEVNRR